MPDNELDPRAESEDICGVELETARYTFICIKKVHGKEYKRRSGSGVVYSMGSDNHYMINKYPNREISNELYKKE